jgi:hypothetical protein
LVLLVLFGVGTCGLAIRNWSTNVAEKEATFLHAFAEKTHSRRYCQNGDAGKGIDNTTPWHEEILLTQEEPREFAEALRHEFKQRGYSATLAFTEGDPLDLNIRGKRFWQVDAKRKRFVVTARVSAHDVTTNNCFSHGKAETAATAGRSASVAVINFQRSD